MSQLRQLKETSHNLTLCHVLCAQPALRIHTALRFSLRIKQMANYLVRYCCSTKSQSGAMSPMRCISTLSPVKNRIVSTITRKLPNSINTICKQKWHISSRAVFSIHEVFPLQTTHRLLLTVVSQLKNVDPLTLSSSLSNTRISSDKTSRKLISLIKKMNSEDLNSISVLKLLQSKT